MTTPACARRRALISAFIANAALTLPLPLAAQNSPSQAPVEAAMAPMTLPYAEAADLVLASPLIVDGMIRSAARIKGTEATGLSAGRLRFYVTIDVVALIRGPGAIPPRIGYLLDVAAPDGRAPKLKGRRVIAFTRPVGGAADQVQLVSPSAQRTWTPALDLLVRRITQEVVARDAPPVVTGVTSAFHVPGSLPGEGETQIFLATRENRPLTLSVLRRPGESPRFAVAASEIVDDSAAPPPPDTLLWYRLACALPAALPASATASLAAEDAATAKIAEEDYRLVIARLGPCERGDSDLADSVRPAGN